MEPNHVAQVNTESEMVQPSQGSERRIEGIQVVPFDRFEECMRGVTEDQVQNIVNEDPLSDESRAVIVDMAQLLSSAFDYLNNSHSTGELDRFTQAVSNLPRYQDNPLLLDQMTEWCKCRQRFIEISKSSAEELDKSALMVTSGLLVGSFVEFLDSFNTGIYQKFTSTVSEYACSFSPNLGFITKTCLKYAPYIGYMSLVCCLVDIFWTKAVLSHVLKAMRQDKAKFLPLKTWFSETEELEESVKKLFPYEIDKDIAKTIEEALVDMDSEKKIFAAIFLSNVKKNAALFKNGKFLAKAFIFCKSVTAKEWYSRIVKCGRPVDHVSAMIYFWNELRELERTCPDSAWMIPLGRFSVKASVLPRFFLAGMSGMSIYSCYQDLRYGTQHKYSDSLRELAKNSQSFLDVMQRIRTRQSQPQPALAAE